VNPGSTLSVGARIRSIELIASPKTPAPSFSLSDLDEGHPYAPFIREVERPGRYLGTEYGVHTTPFADASVRMVLAFPDIYEVGMSHMGTRILYKYVNNQPDLLLDRCMMPWADMEQQLRTHGVPLLSLENRRPLVDYDVVGFSLQYELTYTNTLAMLELGGIPLRSEERGDEHPLVIAGGPTATHPEPLAPFIDGFFIGEAEETLAPLMRAWGELKNTKLSRQERLRDLAGRFSLYVPSLYDTEICPVTGFEAIKEPAADQNVPFPVQRALIDDLDKYPFPSDGPEPLSEAVFDRAGIEVARGCTEGCRFCQAGMIYRPVRERSPGSILKTLQASIEVGGHDEISLTSLSTADYSAIVPLMDAVADLLKGDRVSLAVSSLRAYGLPEKTLDVLRSVRATGLTFAPEAGSQRMRDVINKNISEQDMVDTAERVFKRGWQRMKLYFMMGLPTEMDEDLHAIGSIAERVHRLGRQHAGRRTEITVSVSVHVPKPHTPFQWCAMDTLGEVRRKQSLLHGYGRGRGLRIKSHGAREALVEAVMARGDRTVAKAVELAYRKGCRFDGWDECFRFDDWMDAFEEAGVDLDLYTGTIPVTGRLPWDHIDVGLEDGFLLQEYRRALKGRYSPPCGKPFGGAATWNKETASDHRTSGGHHTNRSDHDQDERRLICYDCGVACDLSMMRSDRAQFLDSLGADQEVSTPLAEAPVQGRFPAPPKRASQGEAVTLRLRFSRMAPAHLVGHGDTIRRIPRILRRAGLIPEYSRGFSPRPKMVFGPTLPLGSQSLDELMDIRIIESSLGDVDTIAQRLTDVSPSGIRFLQVTQIPDDSPTVARMAETVETHVHVYPGTRTEGVEEYLKSAVEKAATADDLPVEVVRKKGSFVRDAYDSLLEIELCESEVTPNPYTTRQIPSGTVRVLQSLKPSPSVRPDEIVRSLFESNEAIETETVRVRVELAPTQ